MSRTTNLVQKQPVPVHVQIMQRVTPAIVLAFVIFAALMIYVFYTSSRAQLNQVHEVELGERTSEISDLISKSISDVQGLANLASVRTFADGAARVSGDSTSDAPAGQDEVFNQFLNMLNTNKGVFTSVRFILPNGSVWTEVIDRNGIATTFSGYQAGIVAADSAVKNAMLESTNVTLSPITIKSTALGAPIVIMRFFAPVLGAADAQAVQGLVELDLTATSILETVHRNFGQQDQRWLLVNNQGRYLADSDSKLITPRSLPENIYRAVDQSEPELASLLKSNPGSIELVSYEGGSVSASTIQTGNAPDMPWTLIVIDKSGLGAVGLYAGVAILIALNVLGCLLTILFISRVMRRRLEPLTAANQLAIQLASGDIYDTLTPQESGSGQNDQVGVLMKSFDRISDRLQNLSRNLEDQLTRYNRSLDMAARISRETTSVVEADTLLARVVDLICDEFNLYHAQVFLLDDISLNAVLAYSRGAIGQQLIEQKFRVQVGSRTMVGQVTLSGGVLLIDDTNNPGGLPYVPNPFLPDVRSQMTVPLSVGNRVIGALDLFGSQRGAFGTGETRIFQLLADQIAIAIHNTRQLTESDQRLQQVDTLNRQLTRNAWGEFQEQTHLGDAFHYNLMEVQPETPDIAPRDEAGDIAAISAPITIRGEVIGTITAAASEGLPFAQGDVSILRAVADRVGLAIEGARLFQETQTSLAVTTSLYELSRFLNEADTLQDVVQAIVTSVMPDATGGQVWLFDEYPTGESPEWMSVAADWSSEPRPEEAANFLKVRLHFADLQFLNTMHDNQVKIVTDALRDNRLDDDLKAIFRGLDARAVVFVPFSARSIWRGMITFEFAEPREFSESEGRIFSALIDQSGVAVDNRLLIQQTELTLDQIERLYAASRIINAAQTMPELVRAVVAASTHPDLYFELGVLEGQLDSMGWPTQVRKVARSENGQVREMDALEPLKLDMNSPLRRRDPEVFIQATQKPRFKAVFPLFSANQPIALMYLNSDSIREMSAEDYEVYNALTGQMSTVLENRRLLEQTERALDESRRLYAASRAVAAAQDSNAVYQSSTEFLSQPVPALNRISILLAGPNPGLDANYFDYVHVWERVADPESPVQSGMRLSAETAPFGSLMAEVGELVYFRDIDQQLSEQNRLRIALQRGNAASAIVVPLRTQRNWFGVLVCESPWRDAFEEQYRRFAQAVADQIAIAVENRLLFDEAQMEAQRALALAEVGQLATRIGSEFERNISEVFARVAEPAAYDRWLLMLSSEENPGLLEKVTWHAPGVEDEAADFSFDLKTAEHSAADAVREDRILLINDPARYPAFIGAAPEIIQQVGKHVATPIHISGRIAGVISIGRGLDQADLDERDEQLVRTLAAQVAVAIENRSLFRAAENEREYLRSILETMPTGIMVLDAKTFRPLQVNAQAESLLGKPINYGEPFSVPYYNLLRTGTNVHYPQDELPIFVVPQIDGQSFSDDIAAIHDDGSQTDLLLNAAPVRDARGNITAIVAAFQDISNLRGLENALQNNLRETIALYEATRALSEAGELEEVLDATVGQLIMLEPSDGYIVLLDENSGDLQAVRGIFAPEQFNLPSELFDANRVLISDVDIYKPMDEGAREILKSMNIASLAVIPMRARDVLLGWVAVVFEQPHDFSPEDERFLTTLSDSAAVAIDNRNLFQSTEVAYQEAATLYETSRVLANASTPEDIVSAVVNQMRQPHITQAFMAVPVVERNGQIEAMQVVANWQKDENSINLMGVTLTADQFPAWRQVASANILTIDNVDEDTNLTEMEQLGLMSTDTKALAVLPLRAGTRRIGVIWMGSQIPYKHSERDTRLYRSFIEQASLSLEATRLLKQTERRARQLATSAQVSQFASSILDMNVLLPRLVDLIRDSFNYDHVQVFLMDSDDHFAELRASTGEPGQQLLSIKHKLAKGSASVIGTVTSSGQPAIALDTADARFVHKPNPYLPLTRSEMALPLIVKNRVVGALDVQSNQPNAFGEEDVTVLTTLAAQISVALDNARLFEQSESRARDMAFLFNVTSAAANPNMGLKESLQSVATLVRNSFDALNVSMYLTETYTTEEGIEHTLLRAAALAGSNQPLTEIAEIYIGDEHNILASIANDLDPVVVTDIEDEPRYLPVTSTARSAVAVPMTAGNQMVGVIAMEDDRPNAYDEQSVNLLRALTSTLSAIVQNAQLLSEVQRSNEQLRELDRLKSDFLANMSHELRTPLNSIIGFSRVILKGIDGPLTEMQEQDLSTIYNSGTHLLGLINDILDQAKINSGKMDLHLDYFDVKPVVEGVRSIGIGLVKDKPIDLRLDVASGMPKAYGDEFRTRQVLLNLVSNASKFTQQGSVTIQVYPEVHPETEKMMIRIDVVDTGIGIAENDLPLLFEAFRQVDSSLTRTVGGTGLGLPIAKSLIEMQGGQMLVKSEVNGGSTFSILLPLEPTAPAVSPEAGTQPGEKKKTGPLDELPSDTTAPDAPPAAPEKTATRPMPMQTGLLPTMPENTPDSKKSNGIHDTAETTPATPQKRMSFIPNVMPSKRQILLIEDNPDMVDQYRRTLQREGFDIFAASIPLEAEAMASGLRPTLIIMDVNFSKGAGWDIMTRLQGRDDTRDIPMIVVTLSTELQRIQDAGAFKIIQRPFTPDQLAEAVKQAEVESQRQRILIIDDQPDSTRLFKDALDENGHYRIYEAHSGHEGVSMIARMRPDLIILDLRMPEMDGFAVLDELQGNPETANIPIMVVTADTLNADEQGHLAGVEVMYKTDLGQENYRQFIEGVRAYLGQNGH